MIWRVDFDENLVYTYQQMRKEEERADMERLDKLRAELDEIDTQMVTLYEKRMAVCEQVGELKIEEGRKVFDKKGKRRNLTV